MSKPKNNSIIEKSSSKTAKGDIPKTVKRYVEEHKEQGMDESKAYAIAWSRYCVTADTVVQTSKGMCTIAELYDTSQNEEVLHSDGVKARKVQINVTTHRGYSGASHIIATGEKPVVEVETKHHYRLTCTPDHKILVLNEDDYSIEWVSSEDAQGRYAVLPSKGLWGSKTDLPKFSYIKNVWNNLVPVKQPKEMTLDLARVLGYLVAEGDITEEGVSFSNTNERIIQDYSRAIENLFGECPDVEWRNRAEKGWKDCGKVRLRTRWYSEFFSSLGLTPGTAHNKVVPKVILKAPKKFVVEFLRGFVEGDGYTGDEDHLNRVGFATASDTLANQLHIILLNLGLPATFETSKRGYHNIRIHGFDLVQKYKGVVGSVFKPISMSEERRKHRGSDFTMMPAKTLLKSNSRFRTAFRGSNRVGSFRIRRNWDVFEQVRSDEPDLVENMQKLLDRGYYFDKIISVQNAGTREVYDLSVPEDSSFVANGLLAHNCKYKYPNSPHCKKDPDEYFKGRGSNLKRVASRVVDKTMEKYVDINGVKFNKNTLKRMSDESMEKADQLAAEGRHIEIKFKYVDNDPNKNNRIVIVDSGGLDYEVIPTPLEALDFVNYMETWKAEDAEQARRETEQPPFHVAKKANTDIERHITEMEGEEYKEAALRVASKYITTKYSK